MNENFNKKNINPIIFTKKANNKYKLISLKKSMLIIGSNRHFPPSTREWNNSVYTYNKNIVKDIPVLDNNLKNLITSYFNIFFKKDKEYIKDTIRYKRLSSDKIHLGKINLKHTSSKVIITLYIYNEDKRFLNYKILNIIKSLFKNSISFTPYSLEYNNFDVKKDYTFKLFLNNCFSQFYKLIDNNLEIIKTENYIEQNITEKIKTFINYCSNINSIEKYKQEKDYFMFDLFCIFYENILDELFHYNKLLIFNKSKLEDNFLSKLIFNIQKMYNKEIELNIVNLNTLFADSEIFTDAIAIKLKNRDNTFSRVLGSSLHMVKLPYNKRVSSYFKKIVIKELLINKINSLSTSPINSNSIDNNLNELLFKLLPYSSLIKSDNKLPVNTYKDNNLKEIEIQNYILNSLKYKYINGIRLEAHGRLTKRFTASRSLFKIKWKGTLKDVDSSIRGWSSVVLRGNSKPNLEYSLINSKTRNGAFGLKGWISGN